MRKTTGVARLIPYLNLAITFLLLMQLGCGAKTVQNTSSNSSRGQPPVNPNVNALGECGKVNISSPSLQGQIGTYYDASVGGIKSDYANVNLTTVPATLFTSTTFQIQIFRWLATSTGQKQVNQIPVRVFFADKLTGAKSPAQPVDRISKAALEQAFSDFHLSTSSVKIEQIFDRVMLVLTGLDMQYEAVTFASYDTTTGNNVLAQGDILLPPFYLDPNYFMKVHPAAILYGLHPLYAYASSGATLADYKRMVDDICLALSGNGSRIPASVIDGNTKVDQPWYLRLGAGIIELFSGLFKFIKF